MSVMEEKHCSQIAQHQNLNSNSVQGIFYIFVSPPTRPSDTPRSGGLSWSQRQFAFMLGVIVHPIPSHCFGFQFILLPKSTTEWMARVGHGGSTFTRKATRDKGHFTCRLVRFG